MSTQTNSSGIRSRLWRGAVVGAVIVNALATLVLVALQVKFAADQVDLMAEQTKINDRQARIMEGQTKILDQQTAFARVPLSPRFEFEPTADGFNIVNQGAPVRNLQSRAVTFLDFTKSKGQPRRIEIGGYFNDNQGFTLRSTTLYYWMTAKDLTIYQMLMPYRLAYWGKHYFEIQYINSAGEQQVERYVTNWSGSEVTPVKTPPLMDGKLDLKEFLQQQPPDVVGGRKAAVEAR